MCAPSAIKIAGKVIEGLATSFYQTSLKATCLGTTEELMGKSVAPNYSQTTTELAEFNWLPPHLVWNGIARPPPAAPYKRSTELRSILIRTGQPSDTRSTYQTEYGWISDVDQSNRTPSMPPNSDVARVQVNCAELSDVETWLR